MPPDTDVTRLLLEWSDGKEAAAAPLMDAVYDELRHVARAYLLRERRDHSLPALMDQRRARASDAQVLQEVMSLLQAYPSAEGFLSTPADPAQVRAVLARLDTGDELGPFRITGLIGAGGMGEVYRAWDTRLDRHVAIKVVQEASSIDGAARERFEAEARAISRLTHPRISTLYDVGIGVHRQRNRAIPGDGAGRRRNSGRSSQARRASRG